MGGRHGTHATEFRVGPGRTSEGTTMSTNSPLEEDLRNALEKYLISRGAGESRVSDLVRLTGGASRETWMLTVHNGARASRELILRRDPARAEDPARMEREAVALTEARIAKVPVPSLIGHSGDNPSDGIGRSFLLMDKLPGEALPRKLLRDEQYAAVRATLSYDLGRTLARIHAMRISEVSSFPDGDQLDQLFSQYLETGSPVPVLEITFAWLRTNRVRADRRTVVHGDFRNGNLLVDESGIRGVLDWELVHLGDPMEDLGWLCVKTWRFGGTEPVGGFGSREDLFRGYEDECGIAPDDAAVKWWEIYGTLRWAVMCRVQANRALVDNEDNALELLAIGRRIAECEKDLLSLLGMDDTIGTSEDVDDTPDRNTMFGSPPIETLLYAVKDFVQEQHSTSSHSRYLARVAINVLDIAAREAIHGAHLRHRHQQLLGNIGMRDEAELALALRNGRRDVSDPAIEQCVRQAVSARVMVANPRY